MAVRILLTGFEPFGNDDYNPSAEAVERVSNIRGARIEKLILPVVWGTAFERMQTVWEDFSPDLVLMTGLAGGSDRIRIERVGINLCGAAKDSLGKYPKELFQPVQADVDFTVGDMNILPFRIDHDAVNPVGYRIHNGKKSVAVATDMGHFDQYIIEHLQNLDAILLESNHDVNMLETGPYPYYLKRRILGDHGLAIFVHVHRVARLGESPHPLELGLVGPLSRLAVHHTWCVGMDVLQSFRRRVGVAVEIGWHGTGPVPGP